MAINLSKGQTINLDKNVNDLSMVTIGLGWKVRQKKKGFFGKMFGAEEAEFDLDAMAFLLDDQDKVKNFGYERDLGGGTEGEAVADPRRVPRMQGFVAGQPVELQEPQTGTLATLLTGAVVSLLTV